MVARFSPKHVDAAAASLRLRLHGDPALLLPGQAAVALEPRAAALLALAALQPGISRLRAATLLWPDSSDPRRNLRQQLLRFRQVFGRDLLPGSDTLTLAAELVPEPDDGAASVLLGGYHYPECEEFQAWLDAQRTHHTAQRIGAARQRLADAEATRDLDAALAAAQDLLTLEPASEAHARALMRVHLQRHDSAAGLAVHRQLLATLAAHGAARSHPETEALARALRESAPTLPAPGHEAMALLPNLLRPPRFVGREREVRAVHEALAAGRGALLVGEAGLGKSRLLAECVRGHGPRAATVSARPGDAGVPYATLARLLRGLVERGAVLPAGTVRDDLARVLPELGAPLAAQGRKLLLQQAIEQFLAQSGVACIAVDDLHFADDPTLELLPALVAGDSLQGLRWLFARRPGEGSVAADTLAAALAEARSLDIVELAPLDAAAMQALISALALPGIDAQALAPQLARHTGGNPLFALETLKAALQAAPGSSLVDGRLPQPAAVGTLIERRLRQLTPAALALARLAAIAGVDFDIELAQAVIGESALALADRWVELEQAQVLRGDAFAHDLVLEAALRTVPHPVAARLHADVALQLEGRSAEPGRIAAHWLAAARPVQAVPHLLAAAERAKARFEPRSAALHYEQAAQALQDDGQRDATFSMWFEAARAWGKLSDTGRIQRIVPQLDLLARSESQQARAAWAHAHLAEFAADYTCMEALGARVLAHAERGGDLEMQGEGLAYLGCALFWRGDTEAALPMMERASAHYRRLGQAADAVLWSHGVGVSLHALGRLPQARDRLEACLSEFQSLGDRSMQAQTLAVLSTIAIDEGRAADAERLLEPARALLLGIQTGIGPEMWRPVANASAVALRALGRHAQALAVLDEFEVRFAGGYNAGHEARMLLDRGWLWLELGRPDRALQMLSQVRALGEAAPPVRALALILRCALHAAGTPAQATEAAKAAPELADDRNGLPLRRALASLHEPAERVPLLRALQQRAEGWGLPAHALALELEQVQALLLLGDSDTAAQAALALLPRLAGVTPRLYPPHAELILHRALAAREPKLAQAALARALRWIEGVLAGGLEAPLAQSFKQRNPVNRDLLAAAAIAEANLGPPP